MLAFTLTAENAEIFYHVCEVLHMDTEEQRIQVLQAMAKLGKVENICKTEMNKEDYIKHLSKHFGNVVNIVPKVS